LSVYYLSVCLIVYLFVYHNMVNKDEYKYNWAVNHDCTMYLGVVQRLRNKKGRNVHHTAAISCQCVSRISFMHARWLVECITFRLNTPPHTDGGHFPPDMPFSNVYASQQNKISVKFWPRRNGEWPQYFGQNFTDILFSWLAHTFKKGMSGWNGLYLPKGECPGGNVLCSTNQPASINDIRLYN